MLRILDVITPEELLKLCTHPVDKEDKAYADSLKQVTDEVTEAFYVTGIKLAIHIGNASVIAGMLAALTLIERNLRAKEAQSGQGAIA